MLSPSKVTYAAAAVITAGMRVKFVGDNATLQIVPAGVGDAEIGTAELHSGKDVYQIGWEVGVYLNNHPGSRTCVASGAIVIGNPVRRAANGAVTAGGQGADYGIALENANDGEYVEVLRTGGFDPAVFKTSIIVGGNSTGGNINLADAAVLPTDRIVEVTDLTTPAVLSPANFQPGAALIVQEQAAGNLTGKNLLFRLISASE